MIKVKICGIRTVEAAIAAVDAGADFLGFNFVSSSKRYIDPGETKKIIEILKQVEDAQQGIQNDNKTRVVQMVGVFQSQPVEAVNKIADLLGLDFVQLHGNEDNTYISQIKFPVIKSFTPIKSGFTLLDNPEIIQVKYLMLDRVVQGKGDIVDLEKAAEFAKKFNIFLAGGLTPENVSEIVCKVRPYAVDVASGVETNGEQDLEKIKLFIERAKTL